MSVLIYRNECYHDLPFQLWIFVGHPVHRKAEKALVN